MIRMFPRRRAQVEIGPGVDVVLFGLSIPSDCRLNGMNARVHVNAKVMHAWTTAMMYQIQGYILPVLDSDAAPTFDTLWDTLVPKDSDSDTIDLDTGGSDTTSMFEPGEAAMAEVMNIGLQPEKIYSRISMKSAANATIVQEEAGVLEWSFADSHKIRTGKHRRYHCDGPSAIVFALGNPAMDDTVSTIPTALAENEWARVKYMGLVLEQALMQHFGLIQAGAETPWADAATLLRKYLEPNVFEEDAGAWTNVTMRAFVDVTFDVSVPGEMGNIQLGTGG